VTAQARLYDCQITHARTSPLRNVFRYGTYLWFVDLDHLPRFGRGLRWLADFRASDHLGDPDRSIRANLDHFLKTRGVHTEGGPITMLAHGRVLGYVFNPLTVFWCHRPDGTLACVVAEVHNTYGERHAYLLHTDDRGRAQVPKEFYVSPFYPVDGNYRMSLPEPGSGTNPSRGLALSITLGRPDGRPFTAGIRGQAVPATRRALLMAAIRHPASTAIVSARIRFQGIKLYLRGLRPAPRPAHRPQEGV
jgi:DUF1365 family protein